MASPSLCGGVINSRRGLLASIWTLVTALTFVAFVTALLFIISGNEEDNENNNYNNEDGDGEQEDEEDEPELIAVTSRALAFAALWTAVLATLLAIYGTVILGWQSPTGQYFTCCSPQVHRTTPIALGSFIGALFMFANLTLVCSALFGEFEIRDYREGGEEQRRDDQADGSTGVSRSSMIFSIMCMFLTIMYAGFAVLTFTFSNSILEEFQGEERSDAFPHSRQSSNHFKAGTIYNNGYIGDRFDVRRPQPTTGFVSPNPEGTMT